MDVEIVGSPSTLPDDDDHPYRTGPWRPQPSSGTPTTSTPSRARSPHDLDGVYLRNTENPVHPVAEALPPVRRRRHGAHRRFPRRQGLVPQSIHAHRRASLAEHEAGGPLWPGLAEPRADSPSATRLGRADVMKDASSTDVVVHGGNALTSFYQCGDLYRVDPLTLEHWAKRTWTGASPIGASRRTQRSTSTPASCCSSPTASRPRTCATA